MIAVDSSALMAVVADETRAEICIDAIERSRGQLIMAASTVAEALIVAHHRNLWEAMTALMAEIDARVMPIDAALGREAAEAHRRWGKGIHRAGLNFGDCMVYAVAKRYGAPLLFIGDDFSHTDIESVL